jgi:hypothetical protein
MLGGIVEIDVSMLAGKAGGQAQVFRLGQTVKLTAKLSTPVLVIWIVEPAIPPVRHNYDMEVEFDLAAASVATCPAQYVRK